MKLVRVCAGEKPTTVEISMLAGAVLPVGDASRATSFYRDLLGVSRIDEGELPLRFRPQSVGVVTHQNRPRLHLDITPRLEQALEIAWERGGHVVEPARRVDGWWRAMIIDSEGNLVALYSAADRA